MAPSPPRVLAVVPARGGSRGLPGKNLRPLAGVPLIVHSLRFAAAVPAVTRCVVTTDSEEIAAVARAHGGDVPFLRTADLAGDTTPMAPVVRDALARVEATDGPYDAVLLLMPTTPVRRARDVASAVDVLAADPSLDGVVSVSEPPFHPRFVGVAGDPLTRAFPDAAGITRRQDAGRFLRVNGVFYLWRAAFVRAAVDSWLDEGRHRGFETDDATALDVDTPADLERLAALVAAGIVTLPA